MTTHPFLERLERAPLLADGATGTQLYAMGVPFERSFDALNITEPSLVRRVHTEYVAAGARVIETNTFGASPSRLAAHGLQDRAVEIAEAGARIAREVADQAVQHGRGDERVWVAGSIGPLGVRLAPVGTLDRAAARSAFRDQAAALLEGGADLLLIETFGDLEMARIALDAARDAGDVPIVVLMTFGEDGLTPTGITPESVAEALEQAGADVVGANCSTGPSQMLDVVERIAAVVGVPVAAMPNAGLPHVVGDRFHYTASPAYLADHAVRMVERGVRLVGGCCGTTPEHVAAMGDALRDERVRGPKVAFPRLEPGAPGTVPATLLGPTAIQSALDDASESLVMVRVEPPKGFNVGRLMPQLRALSESGAVTAFAVADSPGAEARMSALAMCALIQGRLDTPAVLHVGCHYRNLVATHSELLGAHALGIRDILIEPGDLPASGDYPDATVVRDVTEEGLLRVLAGFNRGRTPGGRAAEDATAFHLGCQVDFQSRDPDRELDRFRRLVDAGAAFAISRPVYRPDAVRTAAAALGGGFPIPVIATVHPLWGARHAAFLHNEVPGVEIPSEALDRMSAAGEGTQGHEEGARMAAEIIRELSDLVDGIQLVPPFGHFEAVQRVLSEFENPAGSTDRAGVAAGSA